MNPPAWAYNSALANWPQGAARVTSRPEPQIHPDRLQLMNQGAQYVGRPPPHSQPQRAFRDVARTHHRQPPTRSFLDNPTRSARSRYLGSQRDPGSSSRQSNINFPLPTKSAYPSTHPLQTPGLDSNDDDDKRKRSSRMSTMSARSSTRAGTVGTPMRMVPTAGRYHLVNGEIVQLHDESSDEDIARNELAARHRGQLATKAARQTVSDAGRSQPGPSTTAVNPRVRGPSRPVPAKAARKTHVIVISSDSEEEQDKAEAEFLAVASHIRLPIRLHVHKHLPFLRRNLRRSFMQTCSALGVASRAPGKPQYPIEYVYRYKLSDFTSVTYNYLNAPTWTEYRELVTEWRCAFCDLLGELSSQEILSLHLRRDHSDVASTEWTDIDGRIKITVTLLPPQRDEEPVDTSDDEYDIQEPEIHIDIASREHQAGTQIKREPLFLPDSSPEPADSEATPTVTASTTAASEEPSFHPSATASEEPSFRSSATLSTPSAPTIKLKHELDNERLRYRDEGAPRQPRTGLTADGRLLPPPKDDPQGPAAEPPLDSCRPGGPRIYDLLNELPLEPYGVLAWSIVDREEEIYELVDVRDEDKVVLALWNRWIFFNRMQFNLNGYRNGVEAFLTDNYQMIHRAAGWTALRSFLLVLAANRFLNLREVLKCLAHYDKKVEDDLVQLEA